jgi:hypothetical protein
VEPSNDISAHASILGLNLIGFVGHYRGSGGEAVPVDGGSGNCGTAGGEHVGFPQGVASGWGEGGRRPPWSWWGRHGLCGMVMVAFRHCAASVHGPCSSDEHNLEAYVRDEERCCGQAASTQACISCCRS